MLSRLMMLMAGAFACVSAIPLQAPIHTGNIPSVYEAAVYARKLLAEESLGTLSTVYPVSAPQELRGKPFGLPEYYADCSKDGNPTLLAMSIATSFKNAKGGNPITISVQQTPPPKGDGYSAAAHQRMALIGHLEPVTDEQEKDRLAECFVKKHHDARWWLPGNNIHFSEWMTLVVESIYVVQGFGNVAYIGYIPLDIYSNVTLSEVANKT